MAARQFARSIHKAKHTGVPDALHNRFLIKKVNRLTVVTLLKG